MEQWYGLTQEELLKRLSTNRTGLSEEEAEKRLEVYGENILKEQEEMPWWQIFLGQFKDLLVMLLIGAAGVSMVTGDPESALVIFSVLFFKCYFRNSPASESQEILGKFKTSGCCRYIAPSGRTDLYSALFQGSSRRYPGSGNRGNGCCRRAYSPGGRSYLQ